MKNESTVYDYMLGDPPIVKPTTPLGVVINLLDKHSLSGLPVVDDQHQVVGFISQKDCIKQMIQSSYHCEGAPSAKEVMTTEPTSVSQDAGIYQVADMLANSTRKAYPVVNQGKLVGIITRSHILRALNDYLMTCSLPSKQ